jgi:hypothetical protein
MHEVIDGAGAAQRKQGEERKREQIFSIFLTRSWDNDNATTTVVIIHR